MSRNKKYMNNKKIMTLIIILNLTRMKKMII